MQPTPRRFLLATALGLLPFISVAAATSQPSTSLTDAAGYDRLAQSLHKTNRTDPTKWSQERDAWQAALRLSPKDPTALHGAFELEADEAVFALKPQTPDRVRHTAAALLDADPDDARAAAWQHASYLLPAAHKSQEDDRLAQQHLTALMDLVRKHPEQSDTAAFAVLSLLRDARALKADGKSQEAAKRVQEGVTLFDLCLKARPEDPATLLRGYDVLRSADLVSREISPPTSTKPTETIYSLRIPALLETARAHVTAEDPAAGEVFESSIAFAQSRSDLAGAEKIARQGVALLPENQMLRLSLAALLHADRDHRHEAIDLMRKPITDQGGPGVLAFHRRDVLVMTTHLELIKELLAEYGDTPNTPAAREPIMAQIDKAIADLEHDAPPEDSLVLKTKAKAALTRNTPQGAIDAVELLERARASLRRAAGPNMQPPTDWEIELLLAHAYQGSNQTGLAKSQYWRVIEARPNMVAPHISLARILINEHDTDLAREQMDAIRKLAPSSPDLMRLEGDMAIALATDPKQATELLAKMPEATLLDIRKKAGIALIAHQIPEVTRLDELLLKSDPGDNAAVQQLVGVYLEQNRRDDAGRITDAALARHPDDITLQLTRARIDRDLEKQKTLTLKIISLNSDPLTRELGFYEFYRTQGQLSEAFQHLDAAEKIAPDDSRVLDLRFANALISHRWDEAEKYATRLGVKNYDEANGLIYRYRLHMTQNDLPAAERDANEMLLHYPQYARSWQYLGDVLRAKGEYEQSIAKYTNALERQSNSLDAFRGMIESLQALHRPWDAKRYIDEAARYFPGDQWVHEQSIGWEQQFGDVDAGIAARKADRDAHSDLFAPNLAYATSYFYATQRFAGTRTVSSTQPVDLNKAREFAEKATTELEAVATRWPDERLPYAYLADLATLTNRFEQGEAWLKKFTEREKWKDSNEPQAMLAEYYVRSHRPEQAVAAYAAAVAKGKLDETHQPGATAFLRSRGKYDLALAAVDRASTNPGVQRFIAEMLTSSGKTDEAITYIDSLLAKRPREIPLLTARAYALQKARRFDEAIAACNAAIDLDPNSADAYYYRAIARLHQNPARPDMSLEDFTKARDLTSSMNPGPYAFMRQALSEVYLRTGEPERAAAELEAALKANPRDTALRFKLVDLYSTRLTEPRWKDVQRLLDEVRSVPELANDPVWKTTEARMWFTRKEPETALASLRVALAQVQRLNDPARTISLLKDYLDALFQAGRYVELQQETGDLLKNASLAENAWWVYHARALAEIKAGKNDEAIADFDKALSIAARLHEDGAAGQIARGMVDTLGLDPTLARLDKLISDGNPRLKLIEVSICTIAGDHARAQSKADALLKDINATTQPADQQLTYDIAAVAYLFDNKTDRAQAIYEKVLASQPRNINALNSLALIFAENKPPNLTKAMEYSDRAWALAERVDPTPLQVLETRGWVLVLAGRIDEGQQLLQSAADQSNTPLVHYHLARTAQLQGRREEARAELVIAKRLLEQATAERKTQDPRLATRIEEALKSLHP